jgi:hypothetical protein
MFTAVDPARRVADVKRTEPHDHERDVNTAIVSPKCDLKNSGPPVMMEGTVARRRLEDRLCRGDEPVGVRALHGSARIAHDGAPESVLR